MAQNLKRTLVFGNGISPLGLLRNCLDFALNDKNKIGGIFDTVTKRFRTTGSRDFLAGVQAVYDFRNTYIAHQERELTDVGVARRELVRWIETLRDISSALTV